MMGTIGMSAALSSASWSLRDPPSPSQEQNQRERKKQKRRRRLSKGGSYAFLDGDSVTPGRRISKKVSSLFRGRKEEKKSIRDPVSNPDSNPFPDPDTVQDLDPLQGPDPMTIGMKIVPNVLMYPLKHGRLEPRQETLRRLKYPQSQPTTSMWASDRASSIDGSVSLSDNSLRWALLSPDTENNKEIDDLSPAQSSNATLTEEMDDSMDTQARRASLKAKHNHKLILRRSKGQRNVRDNGSHLDEDDGSVCYEPYEEQGILSSAGDWHREDERTKAVSSGSWRDSARQSPTFDDQGRVVPLPGLKQNVQEISKRRYTQIRNAASDSAGETTGDMFAVICDWYERYTRGTFNFKKMQELPSDIEFDYLPALLTADEYKRMHMSSMYDILWPKWDTKTAEYQMSKALAVFKVKHAALSFFDGDYEVIRAENGYDPMRIDRLMSLAAHALYTGEVIWVLDTMRDWRFKNNPLVVGEPNIRFFAAAPLLTHDDVAIGVFYIFDRIPRTTFAPKERSELHTFADYLLADITMQRADLSHPQLQNLPLPDDGMSDFIRIDTPDPGSIPGVPHCPIRFYKQAPLPAYFSKELDDYFDSEVSGILGEEVVQAQSARQSGHGSSVLDHDVPLVPDESFATSRSDTNPGFSFIDFLRMNDQDFQEERAPKIEQPARIMVRDNGSMASLATSTRSKLALKLEPPPPLRVIKTPKVEDTAFFSSPLSRPSLGYEVLQERASMISFRDESHLEESHSEEADDNPQRGSFESSTTDQTSQSVRYSLSPLLERDSIQPQFRGRSSNRTQVERPPLTRDGTPQPGTVKAAIASFNVRMSTSTNSLSPYDGLDSRARTRSGSAQAQRLSFARPQSEKSGKDSVAPVQPEQLTTTKSEFDKSSDDAVSISQPQQSSATKSQSENTVEEIVSAVHTTQNSSDHQQTSASKPPPESSFDSLTTADTFESEARPVTPDQADLSAAYRRKSEYGSVTILASPSTRKESPALTASDLPLHPSGSQITISKALNAPASSVSSPTEPAPPVGNSESNSPDISTLSAKFQDLTTSPIRAPKQIVEVVKQSPPPSQPSSTPTETKSGSDLISSTEISFPSPPPSNPPPIPRPMAVDPLVIDPHLLAGAAQMFRVAAQNLAYDLIYAVSIFAPNHTSATPVTADEIHIRYLVAHGMQSATQDLNKKLHLNALRSLGIFYFQPPKDANFDPEDWSIGRFLAVPSRFGSSRIRNSGIVVAAFRRASTPPLSNDYAESLQFQEFVDAFKKTIFPPPTFKSKIPQRMASSPALREEAGFPANEAVEMRTAAPSPRATPEIAGPSRLRAAKSRLNLTNSNKAPSSLGKKSGMSWRR